MSNYSIFTRRTNPYLQEIARVDIKNTAELETLDNKITSNTTMLNDRISTNTSQIVALQNNGSIDSNYITSTVSPDANATNAGAIFEWHKIGPIVFLTVKMNSASGFTMTANSDLNYTNVTPADYRPAIGTVHNICRGYTASGGSIINIVVDSSGDIQIQSAIESSDSHFVSGITYYLAKTTMVYLL